MTGGFTPLLSTASNSADALTATRLFWVLLLLVGAMLLGLLFSMTFRRILRRWTRRHTRDTQDTSDSRPSPWAEAGRRATPLDESGDDDQISKRES